jgi:hypothetical protein
MSEKIDLRLLGHIHDEKKGVLERYSVDDRVCPECESSSVSTRQYMVKGASIRCICRVCKHRWEIEDR